MVKPWQTAQFKALEAEWNRRLKESGLKDAEETKGGQRYLKQWGHKCENVAAIIKETRLEYFLQISQWIEAGAKFEDESDRFIMERTSEGWTIKEISAELLLLGMQKHNRDTIRYVRRRYEHKWGIKTWKPEEMVSRKVPIK